MVCCGGRGVAPCAVFVEATRVRWSPTAREARPSWVWVPDVVASPCQKECGVAAAPWRRVSHDDDFFGAVRSAISWGFFDTGS